MKTAEEWLTDAYCLVQNKGQSGLIDAVGIKQIQLDAMKEGMRRAATIVDRLPSDDACNIHQYDTALDIKTAAEQLTEKDL